MTGTRRHWVAPCLWVAVVVSMLGSHGAAYRATCPSRVRVVTHLAARVDSVLPLGADGAFIALVGTLTGTARFLPHDRLVRVTADGRQRWSASLPPYETPPGLVLGSRSDLVYAVVDAALIAFRTSTGRIVARRGLDMQAIGWPAAVTSGPGRLYIVGQPVDGMAAQIEALPTEAHAGPAVRWRAKLGLTHAGTWLDRTGYGMLAVYLPDAHDAAGSIAMIDEQSGAARMAYAVPAPPVAVDPMHDRLYVDLAGAIQALTLRQGRFVAYAPGRSPLAVDPVRGVVAFVGRDGIALASSRTMQSLGYIPVRDVTALAFTADGATLLAGLRGGVARVSLDRCAAPS